MDASLSMLRPERAQRSRTARSGADGGRWACSERRKGDTARRQETHTNARTCALVHVALAIDALKPEGADARGGVDAIDAEALVDARERPHHKTFFAGFTGFGLLYETETGPETKNFF